MKKLLAALALAGSVILVGSMPATAVTPATYPAPAVEGTVSTASPAAGEPTTFSGEGMTPGESVEVTATPTSEPQAIGGSFSGGASMAVPAKLTLPLEVLTFITTADASGKFMAPVTLPTEGTYTLKARGLASGNTVKVTITVTAPGGGTNTGTSVLPQANNGSPANNGGTTTTPGLAQTGADTILVLWSLVGAAALTAGITSVVVVRRRAKAGSTE